MTESYPDDLRDLWFRWRDAQQLYLAAEQSLHAFETRIAPAAIRHPYELIDRARWLRADRGRALADYQRMDAHFIAIRDAQIIEQAASSLTPPGVRTTAPARTRSDRAPGTRR